MEPLAQLEAWQGQIAEAPGATTADLDVAKRLVRHGIESAQEIAELRERLVGAATALEVIADTAEWHRGDEGRTHLAVRVADNADLSCPAFRRAALRDAVMELLKGANYKYTPHPG